MDEPKFGDLIGKPYWRPRDLPQKVCAALDVLDAACRRDNLFPVAFICLVGEEDLCLRPMAVLNDAEDKIFIERVLPAVVSAMQEIWERREKKPQ